MNPRSLTPRPLSAVALLLLLPVWLFSMQCCATAQEPASAAASQPSETGSDASESDTSSQAAASAAG
ncbi:MAG: hypothetical protein ACK55P_19785, partial [Planctomyces sp.]